MNSIFITVKKELRTVFRDKKTLATMFVFPIMIAFFVIFFGYFYDGIANDNKEYKVGFNYEMTDIEKEVFKNDKLVLNHYDDMDKMKEAYDNGDIDCYFTYDSNNKKYEVFSNQSISSNGNESLEAGNLVMSSLDAYNNLLFTNKLQSMGINVQEEKNNFTVEGVNLEEKQTNYMVNLLLSIGITYLIMGICMAASNMGISATATENENGTLETILTLPVSKKELIIGKYLSCFIVSFIAGLVSLAIVLGSLSVDIHFFTLFDNYNLSINLKSICGGILVIAAASLFIAGVSIVLTAFAKTFKEAQSKAGFLNMIAIIPMFITMFGDKVESYYYFIPICNSNQLLNDMYVGGFNFGNAIITFVSTLVYSVFIIWYIIKSYNSEKILFNN